MFASLSSYPPVSTLHNMDQPPQNFSQTIIVHIISTVIISLNVINVINAINVTNVINLVLIISTVIISVAFFLFLVV